MARSQLEELGLGRHAIEHRLQRGRLHRVRAGVFAVGRPELTRHGRWMAAVLRCGSEAALSHTSAAQLWGILERHRGPIHISLPSPADRRPRGIVVHRRARRQRCRRARPRPRHLTQPHLVRPRNPAAAPPTRGGGERGRQAGPDRPGGPARAGRAPRPAGGGGLRRLLDRRSFRLTDSELERRFLRLVGRARLPLPETGAVVNGFRVDFYWPDLGLVVETDGLRYHRTPAQQAKDRARDRAHAAAGLTQLRFTHAEIRYEPREVIAALVAVMRRLPV